MLRNILPRALFKSEKNKKVTFARNLKVKNAFFYIACSEVTGEYKNNSFNFIDLKIFQNEFSKIRKEQLFIVKK